MSKCVMCEYKGKLKKGTSVHRIQVGTVYFDGELPASICPKCGEKYIDGPKIQRLELMVAKHLADHAQRTPEAFRFMRKVLGMRAADLAPLVGVTAETLSRYETGAREIDPIRFGVLATLVADSASGRQEALARFQSALEPAKALPRKVELKVA